MNTPASQRKIRMGMVGGGRGAFIGAIHRIAAAMDGSIELVCGAFSSDPQRSRDSGADFYLPASRCYGSFEEMMKSEAALPLGERMDFVSIVTPNHVHFPAAKSALDHGFAVLSDKPATFNLAEALDLRDIISRTGLLYGLTHNYTGYPLGDAQPCGFCQACCDLSRCHLSFPLRFVDCRKTLPHALSVSVISDEESRQASVPTAVNRHRHGT